MRYALLAGASLLAFLAAPAISAENINLGVLTCSLVKPAQEAAHKMTCGFKPTGTGAEEKYLATIRESGKELPPGKIRGLRKGRCEQALSRNVT